MELDSIVPVKQGVTALSADQQQFLTTLRKVCGPYGSRFNLPRNPIKALDEQVYTKWLERWASVPRRHVEVRPPSVQSKSIRVPVYGSEEPLQYCRAVVENWADEYSLNEPWVIEWAEDEFVRRLRQSHSVGRVRPLPPLKINTPLHDGLTPLFSIAPDEVGPPPPPGYIGFVALPKRKKGMNKAQYRSYIRHLVDTYISEAESRSRKLTESPAQKTKSGKYEPQHFEFLVLRVCGMKWAEIHCWYEQHGYKTVKAISMGAKDVANRIALRWPIRVNAL